jgi:hypothetical protein
LKAPPLAGLFIYNLVNGINLIQKNLPYQQWFIRTKLFTGSGRNDFHLVIRFVEQGRIFIGNTRDAEGTLYFTRVLVNTFPMQRCKSPEIRYNECKGFKLGCIDSV